MRVLDTEIKPLRPIPSSIPYDRMKDFLEGHAALHLFAHITYCRLVLNYRDKISYSEFLKRSYYKNNGSKRLE